MSFNEMWDKIGALFQLVAPILRQVGNDVPGESSRFESKLGLLSKSFCFKRLKNSNKLLHYVMDDNNNLNFKAMC